MGDNRCATLRALLARAMQLLKTVLAELMETVTDGYRLVQDIEADAAFKDVLESPD